MDWRLFLTTFITIFIAELGDKTQFAAMTLGSQASNKWIVLAAVVAALSCAGALGVAAGGLLSEVIDPKTMKYIAGLIFIVMGIYILYGARQTT